MRRLPARSAVALGALLALLGGAGCAIKEDWPATHTRWDLTGLANAIANCKEELNLSYVPSSLVLREDGNYDVTDNARHRLTVVFLQRMFGKRFNPIGRKIDWNNDGVITPGDIVLEGQHCLVFFLGGIPTPASGTSGVQGFSADPTNPVAVGGERKGPYFPEFKSSRLVRDRNGFFVYLDAFHAKPAARPYAYFSSGPLGNDYTPDCPSLGVQPYKDPSGRYINPNNFQIISAGPDGKFGPGGTWDPQTGYGAGQPGSDNLANFSSKNLAAPQQ